MYRICQKSVILFIADISRSFGLGGGASNSDSIGAKDDIYLSETNKYKMERIVSTTWHMAMDTVAEEFWGVVGTVGERLGYALKGLRAVSNQLAQQWKLSSEIPYSDKRYKKLRFPSEIAQVVSVGS